jgi:hypothetical protein
MSVAPSDYLAAVARGQVAEGARVITPPAQTRAPAREVDKPSGRFASPGSCIRGVMLRAAGRAV